MVSFTAKPDHSREFESLQSWLQQGGVHIGPVRIKTTNSGERCLEASEAIPPNTPFLRVPSSHLISDQSAKSTPYISSILSAVLDAGLQARLPDAANESAALLLYLIAELAKDDQSFWSPWFNSLPRHFHTPINYASDLVDDLLEGSTVSPLIHTLRTELEEMYKDWFIPFAVEADPENYPRDKCTYELFIYAHSIIESRSFKIDDATLLVPFADMANHAPRNTPMHNAKARGWKFEGSPNDLGLEMRTGDNGATEGDQLCISYGRLPNWQMLVHYGFTLKSNPDDEITISLQMPEEDQDEYLQKTIVLHVVLGDAILDHAISAAKPLPSDLLAVLRILLAVGDELKDAIQKDFRKMVSVRNEKAVVQQLRSLVRSLLDSVDLCDDTIDSNGNEEGERSNDEENSRTVFSRFCSIYINSQIDIMKRTLNALDQLESEIPTEEE